MNRMRRIAAASGAALILASLSLGASVVAQDSEPTDERSAPVEFTGQLGCGASTRSGGFRLPVIEMSDPRLDGTVMHYFDEEYVVGLPEDQAVRPLPEVASGTWRITNEDGAWQGSFHTIKLDDAWIPTVYPLYGEGAYEGLVALHQHWFGGPDNTDCTWFLRGVIIDGELPEAPTPAT
jgi:hypothetical protein